VRGVDVVRRGPERARVGPWRGDRRVAHLTPMGEAPALSAAMVQHCCVVLAGRGYRRIVTGALAPAEQRSFLADGFVVQEELHLLAHDLQGLPDLPRPPGVRLADGHRWHRSRTLAVDASAFPPFWRLDAAGFEEAVQATPSTRFRIARRGPIVGYAIAGRAGPRGYLQRLAVSPGQAGRGIGSALVVDALRWMRARRVHRAVVNTQVANERALALYLRLGFRLQPSGLAVLTRPLAELQPAP
jgi:ribosomal protein S18 acetylase RimI-like enzyme